MRKVIKKQSGGYVLPNYIGSQSQPLLPNISSSISQIIDPYDRYAKEQQVGIQNSQAYQSVISSQINNYAQLQSIENQKKQSELNQKLLELKAKEFNNTLLKENQAAFSDLLSLDDNIFLEADDEKYQAILKQANQDDESLANSVDFRDSDALYNAMSKRKALLSTFKNAYKNKQLYIDLTKQLDSIESNLKLDKIAASNYLNIDAANQFNEDLIYVREALDNMRYNGKALDPNDPVIARLKATTESQFINRDLYNANAQADLLEQAAVIDLKQQQARKFQADADYRKAVTKDPSRYRAANIYDILRSQGLTHEVAISYIDKLQSETNKNNSATTLNETKAKDIQTGGNSLGKAPLPYLSSGTTIVNSKGEVVDAKYSGTGVQMSMTQIKLLGYQPDKLGVISGLTKDDLDTIFGGESYESLKEKGVKISIESDPLIGSTTYKLSPDREVYDNTAAVEAFYRATTTIAPDANQSTNSPVNIFRDRKKQKK